MSLNERDGAGLKPTLYVYYRVHVDFEDHAPISMARSTPPKGRPRGLSAGRRRYLPLGNHEHAAVAAFAPQDIRGSAVGLLATVQAIGNIAACAIAGLLYAVAPPHGGIRLLGGVDGHRARDADLGGSIGVRSLYCPVLPRRRPVSRAKGGGVL